MQIFLTDYSIDFNQAPNPINNLCTKTQEIMVHHHRNCEFLYVYQLDLGHGYRIYCQNICSVGVIWYVLRKK